MNHNGCHIGFFLEGLAPCQPADLILGEIRDVQRGHRAAAALRLTCCHQHANVAHALGASCVSQLRERVGRWYCELRNGVFDFSPAPQSHLDAPAPATQANGAARAKKAA